MIVYPFVIITSVVLARWTDFNAKIRDGGVSRPRRLTIGALMVIGVLAGVSALRWRVGTDYWAYERNFDQYVKELPTSINFLGEPGIRLLAWFADSIGAGSAGMFALAAFITLGLIVRTIWRWSLAFGFSIAVFILSGNWHGTFNGVRQYLAASILLAGHRYIVERRFARWLLVVLVATLFHVSAIVGLLMYALPRKRLSAVSQLTILVIAVIAMVGTGALLQVGASLTDDPGSWGSEYAVHSVNPLRIAFYCLPMLMYWILPTRKTIRHEGDWFYANMLVIIAATAIAGAGSAYLMRFAVYPSLFLPIALALVTSVDNKWERALVRGGLLAAMAVFMYTEVSMTNNLSNFQWLFNRE